MKSECCEEAELWRGYADTKVGWLWKLCRWVRGVCSAFLWRYEPVRRTEKSDDWLTILFARIIRFTVQKFQLFWVIFCIIIFFIELWHILILSFANMPNGGMPVFTLIATGWWYRKIILLQKSTGSLYSMRSVIFNQCRVEHFNSRFESIRYANRFVLKKNRSFDSLVVKQFFLYIYCIISAKK